jgi:glycosyltransferase involved in cell wall biosynthesis
MQAQGVEVEWIVVDGTPFREAVDQISSVCPFSVKIISEADNGPYDAMNKGLSLAKGEWILFLNAGDQLIWSDRIPEFLSENSSPGIFYGNTIYQYKNREKRKAGPKRPVFSYGMPFCHQAVWYSGSLKAELYYNLNYKLASDYEMLLRNIRNNVSIKWVDIDICRVDPYGLSNRRQFQVMLETYRIAGAYGEVGIAQSFGFLWRFLITLCADVIPGKR